MLTELYGDDFEYVEYDSLSLRSLPVMTLEPAVFLSEDEILDLGLGTISDALTLEEGQSWVVNDDDGLPRFLEKSDDQYRIRALGREGQGPGEFEKGRNLSKWLEDGTIGIAAGNTMLMEFDTDGGFLNQWPTKTSGKVNVFGELAVFAQSFRDSTIAKLATLGAMKGNPSFESIDCIPSIPAKDLAISSYEMMGYDLSPHGEGIAYALRLPFLILFDFDRQNGCKVSKIINLDPSLDRATRSETTESGTTGVTVTRFSPIVNSAEYDGTCWMVNTRLVPGRKIRVCNGEPTQLLEFFEADGEPQHVYPKGWDGDAYLAGRSPNTDDLTVYRYHIPKP